MRKPSAGPVVRVLRGAPDDEELAAVLAALLLLARGGRRRPRPRSPVWPPGYAPPGAWTTATSGYGSTTTKGTP